MKSSYAKQHRQLRVFISSTFTDMNAERDALTIVFPQIKDLCKKRGVTFVPLDLRWGITESAAKQGRVLETCLREIDLSRPFFIGLVGGRYGWIPTSKDIRGFDDYLLHQYPWLKSALDQGMSITEMEMQYAALMNNADGLTNAAFYLRTPKMSVEADSCDPQGSDSARKLNQLREKIRQQTSFPVYDYDSPKQLADMVLADLTQFLNREFPEEENSSWNSDATKQEYILESRSVSLFDLSRYDNEWLSWMTSNENRWLSITGKTGRGKSYLMAHLVNKLRQEQDKPAVVYCDFLSIGNVESVLEFLSIELLAALGVKSRRESERSSMIGCLGSFVANFFKFFFESLWYTVRWSLGNQNKANESLNSSYQNYLQNTTSYHWRKPLMDLAKQLRKSPKRRLFVALDNLDAMTSNDLALLNLLTELPNIRMISTASTGSKAQLHIENVLKAKELEVVNLDVNQSKDYITHYLSQYGKSLDEQGVQCNFLVKSSIGGNPQLLSHVLNLMISFGSFKDLDNYIKSLALVKTPHELYEVLIKNILSLFPKEQGGNAAAQVLTALSLVHKGLTEEELKNMLDLKPLEWAMVRPYILDLCSQRGDVFYFNSADHFAAVEKTLLPYEKDISPKIVSFFNNLLEVRLQHKDFAGNPDVGKIFEESENLKRQVDVLPDLYLRMGNLEALYDWCTYLSADFLFSEVERINFWRALYQQGYSMNQASNPDVPPYLKRMARLYHVKTFDTYLLEFIRTTYKDDPIRSTKEEQREMYQRWAYVAGLLQNQEDIRWLSGKLNQMVAENADNDSEKERIKMQDHAQQLLIEKRYDELISIGKQFRYDDIYQVNIDFYISLAYEHKGDFKSALIYQKTYFETILRLDATRIPVVIPLLCEYGCIACHQHAIDDLKKLLPYLEYHLQQQQPNGIDNMNMVTLLSTLARVYFAMSRHSDSLRLAHLWLEACKAMKYPTDQVTQFITHVEEDVKSRRA